MSPRILVLDNEPFLLELMEQILKSEGYGNVIGVLGYSLPLERIGVKPDLIILDVVAGREVMGARYVQSLNLSQAGKTIPVIVCVETAEQGLAMQAILGQAVYVLPKPFSIGTFLHTGW
ncbi:MAG: response regulator, partial [Chloroflexota bacterium]|nr:response regulator [Chloroflexota bacterium]